MDLDDVLCRWEHAATNWLVNVLESGRRFDPRDRTGSSLSGHLALDLLSAQ